MDLRIGYMHVFKIGKKIIISIACKRYLRYHSCKYAMTTSIHNCCLFLVLMHRVKWTESIFHTRIESHFFFALEKKTKEFIVCHKAKTNNMIMLILALTHFSERFYHSLYPFAVRCFFFIIIVAVEIKKCFFYEGILCSLLSCVFPGTFAVFLSNKKIKPVTKLYIFCLWFGFSQWKGVFCFSSLLFMKWKW